MCDVFKGSQKSPAMNSKSAAFKAYFGRPDVPFKGALGSCFLPSSTAAWQDPKYTCDHLLQC